MAGARLMAITGTILVAGGAGHTGERLCLALMAAGHSVRVMSRRPEDNPVLVGLKEAGATVVPGDFRQQSSVTEALQGCSTLVSCAHVRYAPAAVEACRAVGVWRYMQMSSARRFTRFPCLSSREVIAGEEAIEASRVVYTIIRPTMIFGGVRDANLERLVRWFRRRPWVFLPGRGDNLVHPIFVDDLVSVMVTALERPAISGRRAYTVAGPKAMTLRMMLTEVCRAVRGHEPTFVPLPVGMALAVAQVLPRRLQAWTLHPEQIRRFLENKDVDIAPAQRDLDFAPREFEVTIRLKLLLR